MSDDEQDRLSDDLSIQRQFWQAKGLQLEHSAMQKLPSDEGKSSKSSPYKQILVRNTASLEQLLKHSEHFSSTSNSEGDDANKSVIANDRVERFIHDLLKAEAYDKVIMP